MLVGGGGVHVGGGLWFQSGPGPAAERVRRRRCAGRARYGCPVVVCAHVPSLVATAAVTCKVDAHTAPAAARPAVVPSPPFPLPSPRSFYPPPFPSLCPPSLPLALSTPLPSPRFSTFVRICRRAPGLDVIVTHGARPCPVPRTTCVTQGTVCASAASCSLSRCRVCHASAVSCSHSTGAVCASAFGSIAKTQTTPPLPLPLFGPV